MKGIRKRSLATMALVAVLSSALVLPMWVQSSSESSTSSPARANPSVAQTRQAPSLPRNALAYTSRSAAARRARARRYAAARRARARRYAAARAARYQAAQARRILASLRHRYPRYLRGTTVVVGNAHGYQALTYYTTGKIVINPRHRASLSRIMNHEIWHIIDWRVNRRIDWGERVPPRNPGRYR